MTSSETMMVSVRIIGLSEVEAGHHEARAQPARPGGGGRTDPRGPAARMVRKIEPNTPEHLTEPR